MNKREEQIQRIMKGLKCSRAEAEAVYSADSAIDRGEHVDFDLTPEQEKQAKKYANVTTHKASVNAKPRERKPDEDKEAVIKGIERLLKTVYQNVSVEQDNKKTLLHFSTATNSYKLHLTKDRKKG